MRYKTDASLAAVSHKDCGRGGVLVLGLGNILLRDEGVGVHIVQQLQRLALPDNVEVVDAGTAAFDVLLLAPATEKLVVIDAVRAGGEAGTIYRARVKVEELDELERIFSRDSKLSLHQIGLLDALAAAVRMNCAPKEIVIIGVEPEKMDCGLELTERLQQRVPEIINMVLREFQDAVH